MNTQQRKPSLRGEPLALQDSLRSSRRSTISGNPSIEYYQLCHLMCKRISCSALYKPIVALIHYGLCRKVVHIALLIRRLIFLVAYQVGKLREYQHSRL